MTIAIPTDDELRKELAENYGLGLDADLDDSSRFLVGVGRILQKAVQELPTPDERRPAIFILEPSVPNNLRFEAAKFVPMLNNGLTQVEGELWFVSASPQSGKHVALPQGDDAALFQFVTEIEGLSSVPAVVYDPRPDPPQVRFYPGGLSSPDLATIHRLAEGMQIQVATIIEAVDRFYCGSLVTPRASPGTRRIWKNGQKWHPVERTERLIQSDLRLALYMWFLGCEVRQEVDDSVGRLDLLIEQPDRSTPGSIVTHAVVELKVLRSFRPTGGVVNPSENKDAMKTGVQQAAAYRTKMNARLALLFCFDMRKVEDVSRCFDSVRSLATSLEVHLRVWYLFGSAARYRPYVNGGRKVVSA
jgi:hypothetical protein